MVSINLERDCLINDFGLKRLRESYMLSTESSPQERIAKISEELSSSPEEAQRYYNYISKQWLSPSTPILSLGKSNHGLPISCYLVKLEDTKEALVDTLSEVNELSMLGGGVGINVRIRSADSKSTGVMTHMNTYDACCLAYKQDSIRRGSYAVYLDIDHPDIIPFIEMRKATGDHNIRCHNLHHGVNISDKFMQLIEKCTNEGMGVDDSWDLIDPHTKLVKKTTSARNLWQKILETRMRTGEPFIFFTDTCNRGVPYFVKGTPTSTNLCTEIVLFPDGNKTDVCCLSSLNLEKYDEWKDDELFILDVCTFLDNALTYFIEKAPTRIHKASKSASMDRSIGIGVLGWHSLLQLYNIPIESKQASELNEKIFKELNEKINISNLILGNARGEAPTAKGTGRRFTCTMAIAPNATTSIIMNTSPGIEPYRANAYRHDTLSGSFLVKNKHLVTLLEQKNYNTDDVWHNIMLNSGSVQHLSFLTDHEKRVFKTVFEIDQACLIRLAAERQKYIDQSQSLNLFLSPYVSVVDLHSLHFNAWKQGIKTLYYLRSTKIMEADKLTTTNEPKTQPLSNSVCKRGSDECEACQ